MAALFCSHGRHFENVKSLIDAYILEEQSCQISPRSDLKRQSIRLFEERSPNKKNSNKVRCDMESVADPKSFDDCIDA